MLSCDGATYQFSGLRDLSLLIDLSLLLYKNLIQKIILGSHLDFVTVFITCTATSKPN